jgi:hypothetical protein
MGDSFMCSLDAGSVGSDRSAQAWFLNGAADRRTCQSSAVPLRSTLMSQKPRDGKRDRVVRLTLWASCPFNLAAAYLLAFPASAAGRFVGLPEAVPPLYAALTAFLVALFGFAYGWLGSRPSPDRPLVAVSAIGKIGVFVVASLLWNTGDVSTSVLALAGGDLVFGSIWAGWLVTSASGAPVPR